MGTLHQYFNPPQESLGDGPGFPSDLNQAPLLFLQLSIVLRLLKYPAEDSENPPQVTKSQNVSQVFSEHKGSSILLHWKKHLDAYPKKVVGSTKFNVCLLIPNLFIAL